MKAVTQPPAVAAFIALGSNIDDPKAHIRRALEDLDAMPRSRLVRASSLYLNPPVGYLHQPHFVNAVALVETQFAPLDLLDRLLEIERAHGRVRDFRDAPRTLDLDIVLYGDRTIAEPRLTVPHPRLGERAFVLVPLHEIAPDAVVPGLGAVADLMSRVDAASLQKLPA